MPKSIWSFHLLSNILRHIYMELRLKFISPLGGAIHGWPHLSVITKTEAITLFWTQSDGFVACPYIQCYWNGYIWLTLVCWMVTSSVSYCPTALSQGFLSYRNQPLKVFFFFFLSTKVSVQRKEREKEKDNKEHKIRRTEHWSTSKKQKIRQRTTLWRHPLFPSFHSFSVWLL